MDNNGLQQQIANIRQSFFNERLLNKHFVQLEELEEHGHPNFVENITRMYFADNAKLLTKVEEELGKDVIDFVELDRLLIKFKWSSGTFGAHRVTTNVTVSREYLKAGNMECVKVMFQQVLRDQENLQNKLETYLHVSEETGPTGLRQQQSSQNPKMIIRRGKRR